MPIKERMLLRGAVLFDLDGTLTDSKPGITRSIRYALEQLLIPCPSDEFLVSVIGSSARDLFSRLINNSNADLVDKAIQFYRDRYSRIGLYENRLYDGVREMLEDICACSPGVYLATSKPQIYAHRIVEHFGIDHYLEGIYGSELSGRFDSKSDLISYLLTRENLSMDIVTMIGDRASDVHAARSNGARSIGVTWGYGSERELLGAGADRLCADPGELTSLLSEIEEPQAQRAEVQGL